MQSRKPPSSPSSARKGGAARSAVRDRGKNLAGKAPKQSTLYPNRMFVGGCGA